MNPVKAVLLATLLSMAFGCSTESWQRTGYETLQNIREQQCEKNFSGSSECEERKSYDVYRREVNELEAERASDHN